jgi:hypothetical protein
MIEVIPLASAIVIGYLLVRVFNPLLNLQPRWAVNAFHLGLATAFGIGITSIAFFLLDVTGIAGPAAIYVIDGSMLALLLWRLLSIRKPSNADQALATSTPGFRWTWLLVCIFSVAVIAVLIRLIEMSQALPVGDWDAWAIWNLRAKFLAGPAETWHYALSPLYNPIPSRYPLLLSGFIARLWKAGFTVDTTAPALTALLFFVALLALLVSAVALLRTAASGLLAGLVLLSTTSLLIWAPAQYSDVPLAVYSLGAIALLVLANSPLANRRFAMLGAGFCASFAAWTKDEGISFLAFFLTAYTGFWLWKRENARLVAPTWLISGAAPGVLLALWLKFFLAGAANASPAAGALRISQLANFSGYVQVARGIFDVLLNLGSGVAHPLILLGILAIFIRWDPEHLHRASAIPAAGALLLTFFSYCAVAMLRNTPDALAWQIGTAFDRLVLQLWPSAVLLFFVALRSIADSRPAAPAAKVAPRKSARSEKALVGKRAK